MKTIKNKKENGYVIIDVLITILIAAIAFSIILNGLSLSGKFINNQETRINTFIESKNEKAQNEFKTYTKQEE